MQLLRTLTISLYQKKTGLEGSTGVMDREWARLLSMRINHSDDYNEATFHSLSLCTVNYSTNLVPDLLTLHERTSDKV